jgi:hypothetical protein
MMALAVIPRVIAHRVATASSSGCDLISLSLLGRWTG